MLVARRDGMGRAVILLTLATGVVGCSSDDSPSPQCMGAKCDSIDDINGAPSPNAGLTRLKAEVPASVKAIDGSFGRQFAASQGLIAVGASFEGDDTTPLAYLFDSSGNELGGFLVPATEKVGLGSTTVALADGVLAIGVPSAEGIAGVPRVGAVYMYEASPGGELMAVLRPPNPGGPVQFGASVAIANGRVVVGTRDVASDVFVFEVASGSLAKTLRNPNPEHANEFGASVAASGDKVAVGAPGHSSGDRVGAVFVYPLDGDHVEPIHTLVSQVRNDQIEFGGTNAIAMSGNRIVVANSVRGTSLIESEEGVGDVYVFNTQSSMPETTLTVPTRLLPSRGPIAVTADIDGQRVAVAASELTTGTQTANVAGAVMMFDVSTGGLVDAFDNPQPDRQQTFGVAVAVMGSQVMIGSSDKHEGNSGPVHIYQHCEVYCDTGKACGDLCVAEGDECDAPPGAACDAIRQQAVMYCPSGNAPVEDLEATPRLDRDAEILALELTGQDAAPSDMYDRIEADLQAIRGLGKAPMVAARPLFQTETVQIDLQGIGIELAQDNRYHAWDCLNTRYGMNATRSIAQSTDPDDAITTLSLRVVFDGMHNGFNLSELYAQLPFVANVSGASTPTSDVSDICVSQRDDRLVYIIDAASGAGCDSTDCELHTYWGFFSRVAGEIEFLGKHEQPRDSSIEMPEWLAGAEACTDHLATRFRRR